MTTDIHERVRQHYASAALRVLEAAPGSACCDVAQPTVSHHLKVLREAGWVTGERRGTWIWYSIRAEAVARFRALAAEVSPASPQPAGGLGRTGSDPRPLPVLAPRG